jgi:hypothetical protein
MSTQSFISVYPSYRNAGWAAIASGVIGTTAVCLITDILLTRVSWIPSDRIWMLFDAFDIGIGIQYFLLIPAVFALRTLSRQSPPALGNAGFATGKWAAIFIVLLVWLGVGDRIVSNGLYMVPQGIFGIWLLVVNWRLSRSLPGWLRWFGMVVGLGLALVGTSFIGLCFVYPSNLVIPHPPMESIKEVNSVANTFFHQLLYFASLLGVATLPIWTIVTGFQLLKKGRVAAVAALIAVFSVAAGAHPAPPTVTINSGAGWPQSWIM